MQHTRFALSTLALAAGLLALPAQAQGWSPGSFYLQAGKGRGDLSSATVGVSWPWSWKAQALGGQFSASTEAYLSAWRYDGLPGGSDNLVQLAVVPYLRYTFSGGQSPWFAELGIGASYTDKTYITADKTFGTRWNFTDNIAVGRSFGDNNRHEVSLRVQHISNAGIKKPNPGEEFVQLRYAMKF